jgi:DNA mismatch repair protein MutS2
VRTGSLGFEGVVKSIDGKDAELDVLGKRIKARLADLRPVGKAGSVQPKTSVKVNVTLAERPGGSRSELNVIGCTVDEATDRASRFLDEALLTDAKTLRIVHGHGTGQLRKGIAAFLKEHPLVAKYYPAPREQGGDGATIVELKD